jgi:hypothetical protein
MRRAKWRQSFELSKPALIAKNQPGSQFTEAIVALENHHVFFEGSVGKSVDEIMRELRFWLDHNKIVPSRFSYEAARSGAIEVQLTFGTRHHAELFEDTFCTPRIAADQMKLRA